MQYDQKWKTWDSPITHTLRRYVNAYRRNWEDLQWLLRSQWILIQATDWHGECSWHHWWRQPATLGQISWRVLKSTRIQNSRTSRMRSKSLNKIHKRTFWRNSECEDPGLSITLMGLTLFNDNVIKWAKAKVCVYAASVQCVGKKEQNPGAAQNGQDKLKISSGIPHTKTQLVLMEKQLNSSGISQDLQHWLLSRRSRWTLERKNIEPENFKGRIIFMSKFNDIEWKKNVENCISNAKKVKNYSKRFLPGHWTFLGPCSEKKWYGSSLAGEWDRTANKMVQQFKETVIPFSQPPVLSVAECWHKGEAKVTFTSMETSWTQNYDFKQLILWIKSYIYAAVTNWGHNFALKNEEKEHIPTPVIIEFCCCGTRRSGHVDIFSELRRGKLDDAEWG